jgi:hypothetical protein
MTPKKSGVKRGRRGGEITKRRPHPGQKHMKEAYLWPSSHPRPVSRPL